MGILNLLGVAVLVLGFAGLLVFSIAKIIQSVDN